MLSVIIFTYPLLLPQTHQTILFLQKGWESVLRIISERKENEILIKQVEYSETFAYGPFLYLELRYYSENSFSVKPYKKKFETAEFSRNDIDIIIDAGIEILETYGPFDLFLPKGWIIRVKSANQLKDELNKMIRSISLI